MNTTVITSKGTTTIPKEVRDQLNLKPGSRINFVFDGTKVSIEKSLTLDEVRSANAKYIEENMRNLSTTEARKIAETTKLEEYKKKYLK